MLFPVVSLMLVVFSFTTGEFAMLDEDPGCAGSAQPMLFKRVVAPPRSPVLLPRRPALYLDHAAGPLPSSRYPPPPTRGGGTWSRLAR
jgi:hypothetical protein